MLHVEGLSHAFGARTVLCDLTFSLEKGAFAFLTGPSGSGKTTLLRLLHGGLSLTAGRAVVAGHDLSALPPQGPSILLPGGPSILPPGRPSILPPRRLSILPPRRLALLPPRRLAALRRDVSMVFQDFKILPDRTARENVALPLVVRGMEPERLDRRVASALLALGLDAVADRPCSELAGGEKQRVAIARAVVAGPKLMLADEPTGNLDGGLALRILHILRQFSDHGTTVLMATHSPALVAVVPDAVVIRLPAQPAASVETGTPGRPASATTPAGPGGAA
uniref:Putative ATPase involved in cell division n=1 Tax=Desulfovibrio sp. U5L TaxID=596152 RepID=I2PWW0_9BACT